MSDITVGARVRNRVKGGNSDAGQVGTVVEVGGMNRIFAWVAYDLATRYMGLTSCGAGPSGFLDCVLLDNLELLPADTKPDYRGALIAERPMASMWESTTAVATASGVSHAHVVECVSGGQSLQKLIHDAADRGGWWTGRDKADNELAAVKLALVHSEVSEALEGVRKGTMDSHLPHRRAEEVELADAVIRILDLAGARGLDVFGAAIEKMAYNAQRADHKPEARAAAGGKSF